MASKCPEELFITLLRSAYTNASHGIVTRQSSVIAPRLGSNMALSRLTAPTLRRTRSIGLQVTSSGYRRGYTTKRTSKSTNTIAKNPPRRIAVLGGGITGLTTAHYLARHALNAHITVYESSDRIGGWLDGKKLPTERIAGNEVLAQRGPRMLRSGATSNKYDDLVLYDVLANLKLEEKVLYPKGTAESRYIYYPDHLVRLPAAEASLDNIVSTVYSYFTEELWNGCLVAGLAWRGHFRSPKTERLLIEGPEQTRFDQDESVGHFLKHVFGGQTEAPINNIMSAMLHGIYGGDVWKLSAKHTILDRFWYQSRNPISNGLLWMGRKEWSLKNDILEGPNMQSVIEQAEKAVSKNLIAFEDGLLTLVNGFKKDLESQPNVTIKYNAPVTSLSHEARHVQVESSNNHVAKYDHVISTLFSGQLSRLTKPAVLLPSLAETQAVTIMVVNLWYPNPDLLRDNPGFGYLIPQSVSEDQNPEYALGVLFDSCLETRAETLGTKLTVMLGGHYWQDWAFLPKEETAIQMAMSVVGRHLNIPETEEVVASAKLCAECLPQHTVGHRDRMRRAHYELLAAFKGQLTVAGPSYTSVGVIPSMRAGFDAGMRVARGRGPPWFRKEHLGFWKRFLDWQKNNNLPVGPQDHVGVTGLEWASESEWDTMWTISKDQMSFRRWTAEEQRYTDGQGSWIEKGKRESEEGDH